MSEHTPGKLYLSNNYAWPEIRSEEGDRLVAACQGEVSVRSDAMRLVAAWNACDGIPTADLEELPEKGFFHLAINTADLATRHDELILAMQKMKAKLAIDDPLDMYDDVCAAIEKTKWKTT